MKKLNNTHFCEEIKKSIRSGGGLTPFVGSGLSAQSGILTGQEFDEYLAHVVHRCVQGIDGKLCWNIRTNGWPPGPTHAETADAKAWVREKFDTLCTRLGWTAEFSKDSNIRGLTRRADDPKHDWLYTAISAPFVPPILRGRGEPLRPALTEDPFDPAYLTQPCLNEDRLRQIHQILGNGSLETGGVTSANLSPTSREVIWERAVRSLFDWRSTLKFLSELNVDASRGGVPFLTEPDPDVIDAFNNHITHGRAPNLGHTMLGHLARVVRTRVILTTNFDGLIEKAFEDLGEELQQIPVSIKGRLPSPAIVHSRNTIVKLHGSLSETRADFTLDEPPTLQDKQRFHHYVCGAYPGERESFHSTDLLVVGFSGSDVRCIQMMKFVLDSSERTQIYWICHRESDAAKLSRLFPEQTYQGRLISTICQRSDILFYELYQKLTLSQPPGGLGYNLSDTLPPDVGISNEPHPREEPLTDAAMFDQFTDQWENRVAEDTEGKIRHVTIIEGGPGALATMSKFARNHYDGRNVWLELEDFFDVGSLAHGLFQALATHRGIYRLSHTCLVPRELMDLMCFDPKSPQSDEKSLFGAFRKRVELWEKQIGTVTNRIGIDPSNWLVTLYGRNGPGGCTGWTRHRYWGEPDYGTLISGNKNPDSKVYASPLMALIGALAKSGFKCVYAPISKEGQVGSDNKLIPCHSIKALEDWIGFVHDVTYGIPPPPQLPKELQAGPSLSNQAINRIKEWIEKASESPSLPKSSDRLRFVYSTALFRQSRHYTALLRTRSLERPHPFNQSAVDNDICSARILDEIISEWQTFPRLFHPKPGGFQWLYRDIRVAMLSAKMTIGEEPTEDLEAQWNSLTDQRTLLEYSIADWYFRAFQVTNHAAPLTEAFFHYFQAGQHALSLRRPGFNGNLRVRKSCNYQRFWWRKSIIQLLQALRCGKQALTYWVGPPALRHWFSEESILSVTRDLLTSLNATLPRDSRIALREIGPLASEDFTENTLGETLYIINESERTDPDFILLKQLFQELYSSHRQFWRSPRLRSDVLVPINQSVARHLRGNQLKP